MNPAIITHELTKRFDMPWALRRIARVRPVTAVRDVSLAVEPGELFGLLGPNGAGKTTLVKMLTTLILPTSGDARVGGHSLARAGAIRAAVGLVVADERSFYWRLSARQNLDFFAVLHGLRGAAVRERVDAALGAVGLDATADTPFSNYSTGMKQRVAIARGLLHQPQILFLDEPSRSLDPTATERLHALIEELRRRQGVTIFLITHDLAEAEKLCDRVAIMHQGRLRAVGAPTLLREQLRPLRRYRLRVDPLDPAATAALTALVPDLTTSSAGRGDAVEVTFQAAESDGRLTAVLDCLRAHERVIYDVQGDVPSLEEAFRHLTGEVVP